MATMDTEEFAGFEDHCWRAVVPDEILRIYAPYQRPTYVGERPAVLAIDLYNLVFQGGDHPVGELVENFPSACGHAAYQAIAPIQALLAGARAADVPVIYTTTLRRKLQVEVHATQRRRAAVAADAYDIYPAFVPQPGELVIAKERASAFFGTPLVAHLRQMQVDSLIVCGESTSGCVRASVLDAYSYGFHTVVAEEGCFDRSPLSHQVELFDMHHKYADVLHVDEVLAHWHKQEAAK